MTAGEGTAAPSSLTLDGLGTAPGVACGPLIRNRGDLDPDEVRGAILVAQRAVPGDVRRLRAADGTLTLGGAVLSHVSLLSREFGRPSVSLAVAAGVRLLPADGPGLLEIEAPGQASTVLEQGDVVLIDGDRGTVEVAGGRDNDSRRRLRSVHRQLVAWANGPTDSESAGALADEALSDGSGASLDFLLQATLIYGAVRHGGPRRRLLAALRERDRSGQQIEVRLDRIVSRLLDRARTHSLGAQARLRSARDLDDLDRLLRDFERGETRYRAVLSDLGRSDEPLAPIAGPVRESVAGRRERLRADLDREIDDALELSNADLGDRPGVLYRLIHRARKMELPGERVRALEARLADLPSHDQPTRGEPVLWLRNAPLAGRGRVGGKAAGLLEIRSALPRYWSMPDGFVVTADAYRQVASGEIRDRLERAAAQQDPVAASRAARAALLAAVLPAELAAAIVEAAERIAPARLAVRSSSTVEDGRAGTFAGLFDTYLGVAGAEELLRRVRRAWASLWGAGALETMRQAGVAPLDAAQAVLVQPMVDTRAAGVMFSRDPAGSPDTLLVNATWGLGEAISQGEIAGELYWVRRSSGEPLESRAGRARTQIVLDPERTGTVEVELPPERVGQPCLRAADLRRLAELARVLEHATGRRQDVEFGVDEQGGWVFQVRRVARSGVNGESSGGELE